MMDLTLTPQNELEERIAAMRRGEVDQDTFMRHLMNALVFMPVNASLAMADAENPDSATPLVMPAEDGTRVVVIFSGAERAKPVLASMPGVHGGFEAPFHWVAEKMTKGAGGKNYGVTLNPGWDLCLDFYADLLNTPTGEVSNLQL